MATYYIDPSGFDTTINRNGLSTAQAWKTLSYACARVAANADHIIHVNPGTYTETAQSVLKTRVSIEGEGDSSYIISEYTGTKSTILAESGSGDTDGNQHISNIKMYGGAGYTAPEAIRIAYRKNVKVYNCNISNFNTGAITFLGGEPPSVYRTGNEIHDCIISNCCTYIGGNTGAIWLSGQDGMLIYNNTVVANRADNNNGDIIYAVSGYLKNTKIHHNTFTKIYVPGTTHWDFALEIWNPLGGNEIYNNTINGSVDLCVGGGKGTAPYSVWVHDNIIGQSSLLGVGSLRGVLLESGMSDIIIERNHIRNVASGIYIQQGSGPVGQTNYTVSNIRISYNVFDNIGATTASIGWGIHTSYETDRGGDTYTNIYIWNNDIIANTSTTSMYGIWIPDAGTTTNVSIRNNIVKGFTQAAIYANGTPGTQGGPTTINILSIEHNIFYGNGRSNAPYYVSITPTNSVTEHNIIANPLFVSTTDFHLQGSPVPSPAIGAGMDVGLVGTLDKGGVTISTPPEIGAYEYVTTATLPTVTTSSSITDITTVTATGGGNVTADGGAGVTARGICWATTQNPTLANSYGGSGVGTGSFTAGMTGLSPGTTYFVRAYATNSAGTAYGGNVTFSTLPVVLVPTVQTTTITSITSTTATSGGNVTSDGGGTVTARGVCWSTSTNPTIALTTKTSDGSGTGSFTSSITSLTPGTVYHVRAYATNSAGTAYGTEQDFVTLTPIVLPTVTTTAVTNITAISASSGGNVTNAGGGIVSERGTVWNTVSNPTIDTWLGKNINGQGVGSFVTTIEYLSPGTTYYIRAYATNEVGTAYGNQISFTTITLSVPSISTTSITSITQTTASSGGNITSEGGASVTARGVCWSTSSSPVVSGSHTSDGTGAGIFTSSITSLVGNTVYYVRAYATNSVGTGYGNEVIFTTSPVVPVVVISSVTGITSSKATVACNVTSSGGSTVTYKGICYSTSPNPTTSNSTIGGGSGTGTYSCNITGMASDTTYYVRAFSVNSVGTSYSAQSSFDTEEGELGFSIGFVHHCETLLDSPYGALYNWYAMTNEHNIAPTGWHVPTWAERTALWAYLSYTDVGGKMKEIGTTHWETPNTGATNSSGFTALGSGYRKYDGSYDIILQGFVMWLSDTMSSLYIRYNSSDLWGMGLSENVGCSIRLIKDDSTDPGTMTDYDGNVYNTVKIGTQVWMKENLRVTHYNDGTPILHIPYAPAWAADVSGAYVFYGETEVG